MSQLTIDDAVTDDWWKATALQAIRVLAASRVPFTIYQIAGLGVPEPTSKAQWGAVTREAKRLGVIRVAGAAPSARPETRGSLVRTWVGVDAA